MGLKVWLPLTHDLTNHGSGAAAITNNGATYSSTGGKMGGCYTFGSAKRITATTPTMGSTTKVTVAFWIYITSWNSAWDSFVSVASGTSWNDSIVTVARNNAASTIAFGIANHSSSHQVYSATSLSLNTWYHIAAVYDGANQRIYINGVQDAISATTLALSYTSTAINIGSWHVANDPFNGKLNDVRIYDEALSAKEIEVIARGLCLHYPLAQQEHSQNLLAGTRTISSASAGTGITVSFPSTGLMKVVSTSGNQNWIRYATSGEGTATTLITNNIGNGNKFTISFDFMRESGTGLPIVYLGPNNGYFNMSNGANLDNGVWRRLYYVGTLSSFTDCQVHFGASSMVGTGYIKDLKIEAGTNTAPIWSPAINDTAINLTEYDISGMDNDAVAASTSSPTYSVGGPRYKGYAHFNGSQSIKIATSNLAEAKTLSLWAKRSSIPGTEIIFADAASKLAVGFYDSGANLIVTCNGGSKPKFVVNGKFIANQWNHIVVVFDSTTRVYINNNVLTSTNNDTWTHKDGSLMIGGRSVGNRWNGDISDVRLYSTALSAAAVKEIYEEGHI